MKVRKNQYKKHDFTKMAIEIKIKINTEFALFSPCQRSNLKWSTSTPTLWQGFQTAGTKNFCSKSTAKCIRSLSQDLALASYSVPKLGLVNRKCNIIRYLGETFNEILVDLTPMLTLCASRLIRPTKSSLLKHQWNFGLRYLELWTRWMNVWNFITMWKCCLPLSQAHLFNQL